MRAAAGLRIFVRDEAPLETLAAVFREHGARGRGRVSLVLEAGEREVEMELGQGQGYAISPAMRGAIKSIPGIIDVRDLKDCRTLGAGQRDGNGIKAPDFISGAHGAGRPYSRGWEIPIRGTWRRESSLPFASFRPRSQL